MSKEIEYPSRFKDGDIIWCWDDGGITNIRRWDEVNNSTCYINGTRNGYEYDNYKLFEGELPYELPETKD